MAAISVVFTVGHVATLLGEDEDWLLDLSIDMEPEDGALWVYGIGEDGVRAFTQDGIDNLARSSPTNEPPELRRLRSRRNKAAFYPAAFTACFRTCGCKRCCKREDLRAAHGWARWRETTVDQTLMRGLVTAGPRFTSGLPLSQWRECRGLAESRRGLP